MSVGTSSELDAAKFRKVRGLRMGSLTETGRAKIFSGTPFKFSEAEGRRHGTLEHARKNNILNYRSINLRIYRVQLDKTSKNDQRMGYGKR